MPLSAITAYLERLPARQAEWKMQTAEAVSIPHMKTNARDALYGKWTKEVNINGSGHSRGQVVSPARLKLLGIGVHYAR